MGVLRKVRTESEFYSREVDVMLLEDRLDYDYWHPKYENLISFLSSCKYDVVELSSILKTDIISGTTPEDYVFPMHGIPFLGARNIQHGKIDFTDLTYIDETVHNTKLKSSKIHKGDVLVTMAGSIGRCALYNDDSEANISQSVARLQPNEEKINSQYLVYFLNSSFGQIQFERNKHDVDQPNINTTEMGRIKIVCTPNKPQTNNIQKKIVETISEIDDEISIHINKRKNIWKQIRNAILSELKLETPVKLYDYYSRCSELVDDRFDFIWNHPLTDLIKQYLKSKEAVPLGDFLEGDIEYGIGNFGKEKSKIAFVNVDNLELDSVIHHENIRYVDDVPNEKLLKENDLLITRSRTVGVCGWVRKEENGFTFGSYILRFRIKPEKKIHPLYIANFINSELGQAQMMYLQTGSNLNNAQVNYLETGSTKEARGGGNNINPTNLRQLMIVIPKKPEQQKIIIDKSMNLLKDKESIDREIKEKTEYSKQEFIRLLTI